MIRSRDRMMLARAARLALRAHGEAEPNPTVGCIVHDSNDVRAGEGRTARCGGPHAEVVALREAGASARGGTAWVTLEPCNHHGRTPPCVDALLTAGVRRVVIGTRDPNPVASGGIERLRAAGVVVDVVDDVPEVRRLHDPFRRRIASGRPWVVAKWAETADGDLVAPPDASRVISGTRSHAMMHRERGRVDAILTGIGTVLADDPRLDPRGRRPRRVPRRVVVDPLLELPLSARILESGTSEVMVATSDRIAIARPDRIAALKERGARTVLLPMGNDPGSRADFAKLPPRTWIRLLEILERDHQVSTLMTEAGPGLLRAFFENDLVDAALVFTAPTRFEPSTGTAPRPRDLLADSGLERAWSGRRGEDEASWWHRPS